MVTREATRNGGLELSVLYPDFQRGGEGLEVESITIASDLINCAYVVKLPEKPRRTGFRELPG